MANQNYTGTEYTLTVAFLAVAFLFSPAILIVSRPFGYVSVALAIAFSALCTVLAWVNWNKYSNLTIPSIVSLNSRTR